MQRSRLVQSLGRGLAILLLVLGAGAVSAMPASASATWCGYTGTIAIKGVTVPTGQYCFSVIGSGTHVDFTSGSYNGPIIIDAVERVTFVDRNGNSYASWNTYNKPGRSYGYRYWRSGINGNARSGGSVCGEMMSAGVGISKICHRIN